MLRASSMDIHPQIANWVLEYLLRRPIEDRALNSLLRALPLPNDNPKLQKLLLLKKLESDISRKLVSERTLELLEQLEEIEFHRGNETVSDTMKRAYCAVAVECTVKILTDGDDGEKDRRFNFFEAVKRVWRGRIGRMKKVVEKGGLGSELLWLWKDEIEAAIWDDDVSKSVVKKSEEVNGVEAVHAYIREENEKMGPSFLELVAESVKSDEDMQGILGGLDTDQAGGKEAPPCGVDGVADGSNAGKEMYTGKFKLRDKLVGLRRSRRLTSGNGNSRGAKIVDSDEMTNRPSYRKYNLPGSAEVNKVREALELSSLELQAVVKDPLPDAIKLAETISGEPRNNKRQHPAEDNDVNVDLFVVDDAGVVQASCAGDAQATGAQVAQVDDAGVAQAADVGTAQATSAGDAQATGAGVVQATRRETSNVPRPGLMERNTSAHTYEWDDSIEGSPEDPACRGMLQLPSPRRIKTSPLDIYALKNLKKRRRGRKWSLQEEDALRAGVEKYGKGNWKTILTLNQAVFEGRTEVDLKDKWRNLTRY